MHRVSNISRKVAAMGAAALFVGATGCASTTVVPAGHVGVETLFGDVRDRTLPAGIYLLNPLSHVQKYDVRMQNSTRTCDSMTSDGLAISSEITVRWHIEPGRVADLRRTVGGEVYKTILRPLWTDAVTRATSRFGVSGLFQTATRAEIGGIVFDTLREKCAPHGIVVTDVMVNHLKPPQSVETAVQQKMVAEQEAERTNYVMDKQRIELAFATEKAQFEADRNMMLARAEADRLKLLAASEAERMLLLANAEAERRIFEAKGIREFQKAIAESTSPRVLEWRKIEAVQKLYEKSEVKFGFIDPNQPMLLNLTVQ